MKYGVSINDFAYLAGDILKAIDSEIGNDWCKTLSTEQQDMYRQCLIDVVPYVWLRFDKGYSSVKTKEDETKATDMDLDIEGYLIKYFSDGFNVDNWRNVDIVSEETGLTHSDKDRYICIDPVDGTHNMMNWQKNTFPMFFTSIAFIEKQKTIFSLLVNPECAYFVAKGCGFLKINRELKFSRDYPVERETYPSVALSGVDLFKDVEFIKEHARKIRATHCSVMDLINVSFGAVSMAIDYGCKEWDWRGAMLLAEELGCEIEVTKKSHTYYEYVVKRPN